MEFKISNLKRESKFWTIPEYSNESQQIAMNLLSYSSMFSKILTFQIHNFFLGESSKIYVIGMKNKMSSKLVYTGINRGKLRLQNKKVMKGNLNLKTLFSKQGVTSDDFLVPSHPTRSPDSKIRLYTVIRSVRWMSTGIRSLTTFPVFIRLSDFIESDRIQQYPRTEKQELLSQFSDSSTIPKNQSNELITYFYVSELGKCVGIGEDNTTVFWKLSWFC